MKWKHNYFLKKLNIKFVFPGFSKDGYISPIPPQVRTEFFIVNDKCYIATLNIGCGSKYSSVIIYVSKTQGSFTKKNRAYKRRFTVNKYIPISQNYSYYYMMFVVGLVDHFSFVKLGGEK